MKKIIIKSISLKNWASITTKVEFGSGKNIIKGKNGIGKTSLINAHRWLFTGRISAEENINQGIFDERFPLSPETPEAIVEEILMIGELEYKITKKAKPGFSKPRGGDEWVKSPTDKYTILIDDMTYTPKAFQQWITETICPYDMLPYCIDGSFFSTLCMEDKKKSRLILEELVGKVEGKISGDYTIIENYLKKYSPEKIIESFSAKKSSLETDSSEIAMKIDIYKEELEELLKTDFLGLKKQEKDLLENIKNLSDKQQGILNNSKEEREEINKRMSEISEEKLKLIELKRKYDSVISSDKIRLEQEIKDAMATNESIKRRNGQNEEEYKELFTAVDNLENQIKKLNSKRADLLEKRDAIKSKVFDGERCPHCGQKLPEEMLKSAQEDFLADKKKRIEEIVSEGRSNNEVIKQIQNKIDDKKKIIAAGFKTEPLIDVDEKIKNLNEFEKRIIPFEETPKYLELSNKVKQMENDVPTIDESYYNKISEEKESMLKSLVEITSNLKKEERLKQINDSIQKMKDMQPEIGEKRAECVAIIDKCKEYIEEKAELIKKSICGNLSNCQISMFSILKNGQQVPDCIILDNKGVKFNLTNTASRIKISIEIQQIFMKHFDIQFPIMIDECSVFDTKHTPKVDGQSIFIYASDSDKIEITIE